MPVPGVDAQKMIAALLARDVRFVVVGGFGIELWDVAVQPTVDVDITPEMSKQNLARLAEALVDLDAGLRVSGEKVELPDGIQAELIEQMTVLNLLTDAGPLDLTIIPAGTYGYDDLSRNASGIDYQDVVVPTASLRDIARSKEAAGRPKDIRVLPAIYAHLDRES